MRDLYKNYFKEHFHYSLTPEELSLRSKFLVSQLDYVAKSTGINDFSKKKILEVGSGMGFLANLLIKVGAKDYTGLELDADVAAFTNEILGNYFINQSLEEFDSGKRYDCIFALEVLEHLKDPVLGIEKIYKLLKKDGVFIATTPYPFAKNILSDPTHLYVLHPLAWEKFLKEARFKTVTILPMSFPPYIWRIHPKLNVVIPFYLPFKYIVSTTLILAHK